MSDDGMVPEEALSTVQEAEETIFLRQLREAVDAHHQTRRAVLRALYDDRDSNLVMHAQRELELAGLFDEDSDYEGMLAEAVVDLIRVFAAQGHSGFSAHGTIDLFQRLASYQNLTPLDSSPSMWNEVGDGVWQSNRRPDAFSTDRGQTWYYLDDPKRAEGVEIQSVLHRPVGMMSYDGGATWVPEHAEVSAE